MADAAVAVDAVAMDAAAMVGVLEVIIISQEMAGIVEIPTSVRTTLTRAMRKTITSQND